MIKRKLFEELKGHLSQKEISLIIGPRQAGKTTLMLLLKEYLQKAGENTLFLSLDFEADQPYFVSQRALINKVQLELGDKKGYVFIDEIQRKENAGLFLKGLYDLGLPYKLIVSGSGSLELKEKIHESLIGRKRIFELNTISFAEFINFRTNYRYQDKLCDFFAVEKGKTNELLTEYLNFGGYPRQFSALQLHEKRMILDDIYRSYLERDIAYLLRVEKTEAFSALLKVLASQIGRPINYSELSSSLGIAFNTVKNYLWYAQKTSIIWTITPYFRNLKKEVTKSPIVYFCDLGLRNYALGLLGNVVAPSEFGFLFQNLIYQLLRERFRFTSAEIHFWRTKDKAEVDFIVDLGNTLIPVEVKFKSLKRPEIGRSLRNFISKYQPRQAWVVNLEFNETTGIEKTEIRFLSFQELIQNSGRYDQNLTLNLS